MIENFLEFSGRGSFLFPQSPVPAEKAALEVLRAQFQARMIANKTQVGLGRDATPTLSVLELPTAKEPVAGLRARFAKMWRWVGSRKIIDLWSGRELSNISLTEFMHRLGSDELGDKIVKAAGATGAVVDTVLHDIAQKYESFGRDASEVFQRRARFLSVFVAVGIAFALHVDAVELFKTFMRDPAVRTAVIAQQGAIVQAFAERQARALPPAPDAEVAPPNVAPTPSQAPMLGDQFATISRQLSSAQMQLTDLGVPIGWTEDRAQKAGLVPLVWRCPNSASILNLWGLFTTCPVEKAATAFIVQIPTEPSLLLSLLLGGLLIGLGGPFWFDAVRSLASIRSVASDIAGASSLERTVAAAVVAGTVQPVTPVDAFKVANAARAVTIGLVVSPLRPLLDPDGTKT